MKAQPEFFLLTCPWTRNWIPGTSQGFVLPPTLHLIWPSCSEAKWREHKRCWRRCRHAGRWQIGGSGPEEEDNETDRHHRAQLNEAWSVSDRDFDYQLFGLLCHNVIRSCLPDLGHKLAIAIPHINQRWSKNCFLLFGPYSPFTTCFSFTSRSHFDESTAMFSKKGQHLFWDILQVGHSVLSGPLVSEVPHHFPVSYLGMISTAFREKHVLFAMSRRSTRQPTILWCKTDVCSWWSSLLPRNYLPQPRKSCCCNHMVHYVYLWVKGVKTTTRLNSKRSGGSHWKRIIRNGLWDVLLHPS